MSEAAQVDVSSLSGLSSRIEKHSYLGWEIEFENLDRPRLCEFYVESIAYGGYHAHYKDKILVQPVWLTMDEYKAIRTPLDKESAVGRMLDTGLRAIKTSIDRWWKGLIEVDNVEQPSKEPKYIIR